MKVVCVIQARMGSTRLPGKVLKPLGGHPVLQWVHRACEAAPGVDEVWIATSALPADDVIANYCRVLNWSCHRGSEVDVLSRFVGAAEASSADIILRVTGDCPFVDPQVVGAVVRLIKQSGADFASNVSPRTYPDGLDVQAMSRMALLAADHEAKRLLDRDCVCTFIERNRSRFPAETVINPIPGLHNERWVLDTADDLKFCEAVVTHWPWDFGPPSQLDILGVLDKHPELRALNADGVCNERHIEALAEEPIYARKVERSQQAFARAKEIIPLGAQTFSKSHLQYPQPSPLFVSHGQGGLVWDIDGNEYVDLVSALLPNVLGYRDPDVDAAIRRQVNAGISFSLATELEAELAEILTRLIPCAEMVRFGKTGTDVTTAAVRLARAFTGRDKVIYTGYHGWADWSMRQASNRNAGIPKELVWLSTKMQSGTQSFVQSGWADWYGDRAKTLAAMVVEPEDDPVFLRWLRGWCDKHGIVLIFDEVITGFRFGLGGAQKLFGVTPDLACFGKAMANGMPLSAIVGRRDIMKLMEPPDNIFYSGTFFGEALSLAASIATIKKMEREDTIDKLWRAGRMLAFDAESLITKHQVADVISLSGQPPFKRIKFRDDQVAALWRREMVASGTLVIASHNVCAAHGPSEIKRAMKSYDHALGVLADALDKGDIAARLAGASVGPMVR